jgi:hypothetical protein
VEVTQVLQDKLLLWVEELVRVEIQEWVLLEDQEVELIRTPQLVMQELLDKEVLEEIQQ